MKRMVCILLSFVLCLCIPVTAYCAEDEEESRNLDRNLTRWGIAVTASMVGNSLDMLDEPINGQLHRYMERFSKVSYLSPDKVIIVKLDGDQRNEAMKAINLPENDWEDFVTAFGKTVNLPYSIGYSKACELVRPEEEFNYMIDSDLFSLIILPYGEDIAIISSDKNGPVNGSGSFIISTENISRNLDKADIETYFEKYNVKDADVCVYEKDELNDLLTEEKWYTDPLSDVLTNSVISSDKRMQTMLPEFLASKEPTICDNQKYQALDSVLGNMEQIDQAMIRKVASKWLPQLDNDEADPGYRLVAIEDPAYDNGLTVPQISYGEKLKETKLKENGTYLVVFDREIPDETPTSWYDVRLEASIPAKHIPTDVNKADYIIRCHVIYNKGDGVSNGDAHLHYPTTQITVHDAKSGEMLQDLGSVKRMLNGVVMISKGDTWWSPLRTQTWEMINTLFDNE